MPPRDLSGMGRHPPVPLHEPLAFFASARGGDPASLAGVAARDPYFPTQDNGAGSALHVAVTHCRLDMVHFLLSSSCGPYGSGGSKGKEEGAGAGGGEAATSAAAAAAADSAADSPASSAPPSAPAAAPLCPAVNQRDFARGFTPLHRAAALAHVAGGGYLEIYEYLLSRGADPDIPSDDFDPYLDPGPKFPRDLAANDATRAKIVALERRYAPPAAAEGGGGGGGADANGAAVGGNGSGGAGSGVAKGGQPRAPRAHPRLGCFWALYDHGPDEVLSWPTDKAVVFPEEEKRARDRAERKAGREGRRTQRDAGGSAGAVTAAAASAPSLSPPPTANITVPPSSQPPCVYLFPGQGSQELGRMLSRAAAARLPAVAAMLSSAQNVLGYDLLELVEGPADKTDAAALAAAKERLDDTRHAQPALFVAGLAALEALKAQQQQQQQQQQGQGQQQQGQGQQQQQQQQGQQQQQQGQQQAPVAPLLPAAAAVAGLSLGEYCALVAAGALSFEDGLRVVKARGEAMAAAAAAAAAAGGEGGGGRPHGMLSVVGLPDARLEGLVDEARAEAEAAWVGAGGGGKQGGGGGGGGGNNGGEEGGAANANGSSSSSTTTATTTATVLEVANLLFPEGRVVSGHHDALRLLKAKAEAAGALKATILKVAGAFHTRLMQPAAEALRCALDAADLRPLGKDAPLVISNVTGRPFPLGDVGAVKALLCRQLVEPVRWEQSLRAALALGGGGGGGGGGTGAAAGSGAAGGGSASAAAAPSAAVRLFELGPGQQLKAMVRRLDTAAWKGMINVAAV